MKTNLSYKYDHEPVDQATTSNRDKEARIQTRTAENAIYESDRDSSMVRDREYEDMASIKDNTAAQ